MDEITKPEPLHPDGDEPFDDWAVAIDPNLPCYAGTAERFRELVQEALSDIAAGRLLDLDDVFVELQKEFGDHP